MSKRKLEDFKDDSSQFKFYGIINSRFIWNSSYSEVAKLFFRNYITKAMNKFEMKIISITNGLKEDRIKREKS